jgi:hypothetical protein
MKSLSAFAILLLLTINNTLSGQQNTANWEKWKYLIGEWVGESNGQPGQGEGSFSFQTDLDGKILVRKNHTIFPETTKSALKIHEDLLIVYPGNQDNTEEAIYFDNEGNTIKYNVTFKDNDIILTSIKKQGNPGFRLIYTKIDDKTVKIDFEMASPGTPESYRTYLSGKAFRVKE